MVGNGEGSGVEEEKHQNNNESDDTESNLDEESICEESEGEERRNKYRRKNSDDSVRPIRVNSAMWNELWLMNFCIRRELSAEAGQELIDWVKYVSRT